MRTQRNYLRYPVKLQIRKSWGLYDYSREAKKKKLRDITHITRAFLNESGARIATELTFHRWKVRAVLRRVRLKMTVTRC